jgi:hypothetical protein
MRNRRNVLSELIAKHGLKIGAETGVGSGPTTHFLLEAHPDLHWIGVDHFPAGFPLVDGSSMPQERQDKYRTNYAMLVELHAPRLTWIDAPVPEAASQVADGSLDLVFIDDDHSYEGCKAAILAWRSKVRPGGWLAGHDYYPERFPGVVKAVKELIPGFGVADDFVWLTKVTS